MNRKLGSLFITVVLVLVTLGCGLSGKPEEPGGEDVQNTVAPTEASAQPTNTPQPTPTDAPEPTETPELTVGSDVELGEVYRSDAGGYGFQVVPGYAVDEFLGITSMQAPDADPQAGPTIVMIGGLNEQETTAQQLYGDFVGDLEEGLRISEPREAVVDGVTGLVADVSGAVEGQDVAGRIVMVAVTSRQMFSMVGAAPADRWEGELEPLFQAVLASVTFFEPVVDLELDVEPTKEVVDMGGVERQWASTATASSEYSNPDWAAMRATGAPDTLKCGDYPTAWASAGSNTVEWIELGYDFPVLPTEVNIVQTYTPNQVVKVELLDVWGEYHTVYTGTPEDKSDQCPYTLSIAVEGADAQVTAVKITLDQSVIGYWNEIDAVELVGVPEHPVMMGESAYVPEDVVPGGFIFEVIGAGEDAVIDGGVVQDNSPYNEYGVAFIQEGALARYSMTLYLPHDVEPGVIELVPYDRSASPRGPSAAVAVGVWFYYATAGTLTIYDTSGDTITGDFYFQAMHEEDAAKTITVMGAFNQVPLVKQ